MGSKIISRPLHLNSKIFINRHGFELKSITVRHPSIENPNKDPASHAKKSINA